MPSLLNLGSGQRPFPKPWINIDIQPKWNPDIVADWNNLSMFAENSVDYVVSSHSLEHVGCGEADNSIREVYRVLKKSGSFIVFVPDPIAIAHRLLRAEIDEYTYNVLTYGAYMGEEFDRHKWSYSRRGLLEYLMKLAAWRTVRHFDGRPLHGADLPSLDWWFYATEAIK